MKQVKCPSAALRCGGCSGFETSYSEQLLEKQRQAEKLLGRFGRVETIRGMEDPLHYRCKAIASFAEDARGRLRCGLYEAGTHRVIPAHGCLLQDAEINRVLAAAESIARRNGYEVWQGDRSGGLLRHLLVRRGAATGQISVTVVTGEAIFPGCRNFARDLVSQCPDVVTVVQNINPRQTSVVLGDSEKVIRGSGFCEDVLCGNRFRISSQAFCQVNPKQAGVLYTEALGAARLTGSERCIDAYCGIGAVTLAAARNVREILGIELNRRAVADARCNARLNGISNVRFDCADAGAAMQQMAEAGIGADIVFLDPPREGADRRFLDSLIRLSPARIAYISCSPATLSRDLGILTAKGYRAERIIPVDMFPFTPHVETVVLLSRDSK